MNNKYYFSGFDTSGIINASSDLECIQKLIGILSENNETFIDNIMNCFKDMDIIVSDLSQLKEYE